MAQSKSKPKTNRESVVRLLLIDLICFSLMLCIQFYREEDITKILVPKCLKLQRDTMEPLQLHLRQKYKENCWTQM